MKITAMKITQLALTATLALAAVAQSPASAQDAPLWNRRLVGVRIEPNSASGPGLYDVHADVFVSTNTPSASSLSLGLVFWVYQPTPQVPLGWRKVSLEWDDAGGACAGAACPQGNLCATLDVDAVPRLAFCSVFPPHPDDDVSWCGCSTTVRVVVEQLSLAPGEELLLVVAPDDGTVPELYPIDDQWTAVVPEEDIRPFCFGDGSGAPCPCGNEGFAGQGCRNSTGAGAVLATYGTTSVAADDLWLRAHDLPIGQPALLFTGDDALNGGLGVPFGDGLRCVGTNVERVGVVNANANGAASWGPGLAAALGWTAGDHLHAQVWFRDPSGGPCNSAFNLTNGVELQVTP